MSTSGREKARDILVYMEEQFEDGKQYFKSRHISDELGYSRKEVGSVLGMVDREYRDILDSDEVDGEYTGTINWGGSSSTTWNAKPLFADDDVYEQINQRFQITETGPNYT